MIISASRRTDIPSFHSEWFMERVRDGYVIVSNPRNPKQQKTISLNPSDVTCFVFWTKNPEPLIPYLEELDRRGFKFYFQYTITPYDVSVEKNLPPKKQLIELFKTLSDKIGGKRIIWRYDPIIINDEFTVNYHSQAFENIATELSGHTDSCIISFVDSYKFITKRCKGIIDFDESDSSVYQLAEKLSKIAIKHRMDLTTCCEKYDLNKYNIQKGSCINKKVIENIVGHSVSVPKDRGQRSECGCIKSVDIGRYNSCGNGCIYCYAMKSNIYP